jgi:hypothetical protein
MIVLLNLGVSIAAKAAIGVSDDCRMRAAQGQASFAGPEHISLKLKA